MAKFNVGDKVKILDGSNIENYAGGWINSFMSPLVGSIITISSITTEGDKLYYTAKENYLNWDERGLELVDIMTKTASGLDKKCSTVTNYYVEHFKKYDTTYIRTVLEFADGSKETVECNANKFDTYNGFLICYAKHIAKAFLGKNISNIADYWIIKRPKQIAEERAKEDMRLAEKKRLAERDKKRREKQRIRLEAIRRKEAYEAAKLAEEKYGVPADWNEGEV